MDSPAAVLDLPGVAVPGKILATKAISVQSLSVTVLSYPLGGPKALGLFQKSCHIAVNVLSHFILSFHSGTARAMKVVSATAGLSEARAGVVHGVDRHAGMLDEQVFQRTGLHLDGGQASRSETRRRGDEPALLQGAGLQLEEAGVAWVSQAFERGR